MIFDEFSGGTANVKLGVFNEWMWVYYGVLLMDKVVYQRGLLWFPLTICFHPCKVIPSNLIYSPVDSWFMLFVNEGSSLPTGFHSSTHLP